MDRSPGPYSKEIAVWRPAAWRPGGAGRLDGDSAVRRSAAWKSDEDSKDFPHARATESSADFYSDNIVV